jgi:hypothetical protein
MALARLSLCLLIFIASLVVLTTVPSLAQDRVAAAGGQQFTVFGPTCRFASCWAFVTDISTGQGTLVRGRGVIGTRTLAQRKLRELTADIPGVIDPVRACPFVAAAIDL